MKIKTITYTILAFVTVVLVYDLFALNFNDLANEEYRDIIMHGIIFTALILQVLNLRKAEKKANSNL